jgi:hypothetical protein
MPVRAEANTGESLVEAIHVLPAPRRGGRGSTHSLLLAGGDSGDRTRNLRLAKPALSQLSYIPWDRSAYADASR